MCFIIFEIRKYIIYIVCILHFDLGESEKFSCTAMKLPLLQAPTY